MMLLSHFLGRLIGLILVCSSAKSADISAVRQLRDRDGTTIHLPVDCPFADLIASDEVLDGVVIDSSIQLLSRFIEEGSMVLDVFGGCGLRFVAFARLVGPNGRVVGVENFDHRMEALKSTTMENGIWNRALLVYCSLQATEHPHQLASQAWSRLNRSDEDSDFTRSDVTAPAVTMKNLIEIIGGIASGCPSVLIIGGYGHIMSDEKQKESTGEKPHVHDHAVYKALLGSRLILEACRPIVYFTSQNWQTLRNLRWFFKEVKYQMYRHNITTITRGTDSFHLQHFAALASPVEGQLPEGDPMCLEQLQKIEMPLKMRDELSINVEVVDVLHPQSLLMKSIRKSLRNADNSVFEAIEPYYSLETHFSMDTFRSEIPSGSLLSQAEITCLVWSNRIFQRLFEKRFEINGFECSVEFDLCEEQVAQTLLTEEVQLIEHCTDHIYSRLVLIFRLFEKRTAKSDAKRLIENCGAVNELDSVDAMDESVDVNGQKNCREHRSDALYSYYRSNATSRILLRRPFEFAYDWTACGEPIWCSHTKEMQKLIHRWQHPHTSQVEEVGFDSHYHQLGLRRTCNNSKILVYEPPTHLMGIGSIFQLIVATMRYAICLDRILVLNWMEERNMRKWRHPGCQGSTFECYFEQISDCDVTESEMKSAPLSFDGDGFDEFPLRNERILVLKGIAVKGQCQTCYSTWRHDSRFFDGYYFGQTKELPSGTSKELTHMGAFMSIVKETWSSQFLRYLLRPRSWFAQQLDEIIDLSFSSSFLSAYKHKNSSPSNTFSIDNMPNNFVSLHIRYGMKVVELELQPLSRYMSFLQKKLPHLKDVFVSTETESLIPALIREYPDHRFHFLQYDRIEFLKLDISAAGEEDTVDFIYEFLFSMANLRVSVEANGFVGTLSSNWCMMIMQLERTRGDGGFDYFSMDRGSAYTLCY